MVAERPTRIKKQSPGEGALNHNRSLRHHPERTSRASHGPDFSSAIQRDNLKRSAASEALSTGNWSGLLRGARAVPGIAL